MFVPEYLAIPHSSVFHFHKCTEKATCSHIPHLHAHPCAAGVSNAKFNQEVKYAHSVAIEGAVQTLTSAWNCNYHADAFRATVLLPVVPILSWP